MIKSLNHLKYRFGQDRITINQKDIDAFNEIIGFYQETQSRVLEKQELFLKLFLEMFLQETTIHSLTAQSAVEKLKNVLKNDIEDYYKLVADEIPLLRFQYQLQEKGITPLYTAENGKIKVNNSEAVLKKNEALIKKNQKVLEKALTTEMTPQQAKTYMQGIIMQVIREVK